MNQVHLDRYKHPLHPGGSGRWGPSEKFCLQVTKSNSIPKEYISPDGIRSDKISLQRFQKSVLMQNFKKQFLPFTLCKTSKLTQNPLQVFGLWKEERRGDETKERSSLHSCSETQTLFQLSSTLWISVLVCAAALCFTWMFVTDWELHRHLPILSTENQYAHRRNKMSEQIKSFYPINDDNPIHLVLLLWDVWFCVFFWAPFPPVFRFHPSPPHSSRNDPNNSIPAPTELPPLSAVTPALGSLWGWQLFAKMELTFTPRGDFHGEAAKPSWWALKSTHYSVNN